MSTIALIVAGELRGEQVVFTLELLPALGVGLLASIWGARHLEGRSLRPAVLTFATVAGAAALLRGVT